MHSHKDILRTGFIALLALSITLSLSISNQVSPGYAQQPFNTVAPVNATFTPPVNTAIPVPTPLPTLGPGQFFDEESKPRLLSSHGDDRFGWGELEEDNDLVLIWATDEQGTHYLVVEKDNDFFLGDAGLKNGFVDYIGDQDSGRAQLLDKLANNKNAVSVSGGLGIGFGILLIIGPAGWVTGLAIGGFTAIGNGIRERLNQNTIRSNIEDLEFNLLGKYTQMVEQLSHP